MIPLVLNVNCPSILLHSPTACPRLHNLRRSQRPKSESTHPPPTVRFRDERTHDSNHAHINTESNVHVFGKRSLYRTASVQINKDITVKVTAVGPHDTN